MMFNSFTVSLNDLMGNRIWYKQNIAFGSEEYPDSIIRTSPGQHHELDDGVTSPSVLILETVEAHWPLLSGASRNAS